MFQNTSIDTYQKTEKFSFKCENCKLSNVISSKMVQNEEVKLSNGEKLNHIVDLPKVLTLLLKRFFYDEEKQERVKLNDRLVNFIYYF